MNELYIIAGLILTVVGLIIEYSRRNSELAKWRGIVETKLEQSEEDRKVIHKRIDEKEDDTKERLDKMQECLKELTRKWTFANRQGRKETIMWNAIKRWLGEEPDKEFRLRITLHLDDEHKTYYRGVIEVSNHYDVIEMKWREWNSVLVTSIEDRYRTAQELVIALGPIAEKCRYIIYPNYSVDMEEHASD